MKMEVGQKYKGYALLNEFGEFEFTPEDTGSRAGVIKKVTTGNGFEVCSTSKYILFRVKIRRAGNVFSRLQELMLRVDDLLNVVRKYEF